MDYPIGHSWISFQTDFKAAAPQLWLLLGEAQARCSQISSSPLSPEAAREIGRIRTARFLLASAAIAGNTLTEDDIYRHLDGRLDLAPAQRPFPRPMANLAAALVRLRADTARGAPAEVTPDLLRDLNRLALAGAPGTSPEPGALRCAGTPGPPGGVDPGPDPDRIPALLEKLGEWLAAPRAGSPLVVALLKAFLAHLHVAWIRPFADGNGRTARLLEAHILAHAGVPEPALGLATAHQGRDRQEYFRQIERAKRSASGPTNFVIYAAQGFVEELRGLQEEIAACQRVAAWREQVAAALPEEGGKAVRRQRRLLLALGAAAGPIPTSRVRAASPETALAYAGLNEKTLRRDLAELRSRGLLERVRGGWRARREAAEPWRAGPGARASSQPPI